MLSGCCFPPCASPRHLPEAYQGDHGVIVRLEIYVGCMLPPRRINKIGVNLTKILFHGELPLARFIGEPNACLHAIAGFTDDRKHLPTRRCGRVLTTECSVDRGLCFREVDKAHLRRILFALFLCSFAQTPVFDGLRAKKWMSTASEFNTSLHGL